MMAIGSRSRNSDVWLAFFALAAILRVAGVFTDFWLDEIWSFNLASSIHSPFEVFTALHHDNNHYLNTLFMYALGDRADWRWYRILSLLAGIAAVPLAAAIGRRRSAAAGWAAGVLFGLSYPLIVYSSEARGYAPMIFFVLLSYYFLEEFLEKKSARTAALFSGAAVLGFCSQLTFIHFYVAALALSVYRLKKSPLELVRLHLAPCLFLVWLYWIDVRHMRIGGGLEEHPIARALTLSLGLPDSTLLAALVFLSLLSLAASQWEERADRGLLFLVGILVSPALVLLVIRPQTLFSRYFLVPTVLFLLLLAQWLGRIFEKRRRLYFSVLALFCAGNGAKIFHFLEYGRGHYAQAVDYMLSRGGTSAVTVASDHDFRNATVLGFYAQRAASGVPIVYCTRAAKAVPNWRILHTFDPEASALPEIEDAAGRRYVFEKKFPHWGLSGWTWLLYRRAGG